MPSNAATVQSRDVQILPIGPGTTTLRSRTWDRLKFEIEYSLQKGTTANSYLLQGDAIALIDPPGETFTPPFLMALAQRIQDQTLDYIILGHINPNRYATLEKLLDLHPNTCIVCSNPAAKSLKTLLGDRSVNIRIVKGEDTLDLGQQHQLRFVPIPTPRWPDGLATFDTASQFLFSDKFYGAHVCGDQVFDEGWQVYANDRRFYFDSLHAAQSKQVAVALEKLAVFDAIAIAPNHGPIVRYGLSELTQLYRTWTETQANQALNVALLYASAYGNTAAVAQAIASGITKAGVSVASINCEQASAEDITAAIEACNGFIIGSPTLGGHAPTQVQTALGLTISTAAKTKPAGVFGSFGWSGEAIDLLETKLQDAGYTLAMDTIRVKFAPTAATLKTCEEAGTDFAQKIKRTSKRRVAQPAAVTGTADRTAQAVGRVVGALCVVSAKREDVETAMLASWVAQATFNPPGLTVSVAKERAIELLMNEGDRFVLNILPDGTDLWKQFVKNYAPGQDRFEGIDTEVADNGCRILKDAIAYLECTVQHRMECGDHWLTYATADHGLVLDSNRVTALHHRKSGTHY